MNKSLSPLTNRLYFRLNVIGKPWLIRLIMNYCGCFLWALLTVASCSLVIADVESYHKSLNPARIGGPEALHVMHSNPYAWNCFLIKGRRLEFTYSRESACFFRIYQIGGGSRYLFERINADIKDGYYTYEFSLTVKKTPKTFLILIPTIEDPGNCEVWMESVGLENIMFVDDFNKWTKEEHKPGFAALKFTVDEVPFDVTSLEMDSCGPDDDDGEMSPRGSAFSMRRLIAELSATVKGQKKQRGPPVEEKKQQVRLVEEKKQQVRPVEGMHPWDFDSSPQYLPTSSYSSSLSSTPNTTSQSSSPRSTDGNQPLQSATPPPRPGPTSVKFGSGSDPLPRRKTGEASSRSQRPNTARGVGVLSLSRVEGTSTTHPPLNQEENPKKVSPSPSPRRKKSSPRTLDRSTKGSPRSEVAQSTSSSGSVEGTRPPSLESSRGPDTPQPSGTTKQSRSATHRRVVRPPSPHTTPADLAVTADHHTTTSASSIRICISEPDDFKVSALTNDLPPSRFTSSDSNSKP